MREEVDGTDDHRQSGEYMNNMSAGRPANHPPTTHPPLVCCCSPSRHASRQVWDWCEAEWEAAEAGRYKESARSFLISSWQGDALAVRGGPSRHGLGPAGSGCCWISTDERGVGAGVCVIKPLHRGRSCCCRLRGQPGSIAAVVLLL